MTIGFVADFAVYALIFCVGFASGINFRGNPPKRTRKTRKLTAPNWQPEDECLK